MRIKRFIAPDMRTALRMVRDEQGPDAVILSNRSTADGIEVVAATDYDEALVAQALRAAAPGLETIVAPGAIQAASSGSDDGVFVSIASIAAHPAPTTAPVTASTTTAATAATAMVQPVASAGIPAPRDSLAARARAVFRMGDGPTLAELSAAPAAAALAPAPTPVAALRSPPLALVARDDEAHEASALAPTRMEAMMAAMGANIAPAPVLAATNAPEAAIAEPTESAPAIAAAPNSFAAALAAATFEPDDWASVGDDYHVALTSVATPVAPIDEIEIQIETEIVASAAEIPAAVTLPAPTLHAVPTAERADPSMLAMREELACMRQLMERQMEQLSLERLRGSPARAAAYEALLGYGCEDVLAQAVAAKIDARLPVSDIQVPMFAELARMLTVSRTEPLDDGGVIALVGPTGAGKTTTAAKLAARFAARHRARDVALVTTDSERAGAHEQLHAHGRRLGITVCEAAGPEGLQDALAQLSDYPLVLVDTTGYAPRDRALFTQILWLRSARKVRSLLVLPANAHPHDLGEVIRRYRPAAPEGVVLTKLDETGRLGSALSVAVRHGLTLSYTTHGQQVPSDIDTADATRLSQTLEKLRRAADNPLATEDRHAHA